MLQFRSFHRHSQKRSPIGIAMRGTVLTTLIAIGVAFTAHARCSGLDSFALAGCNGTGLASCVKRQPAFLPASRLDAFATWIDTLKKNDPCSTKVADLAERYATFNDTQTHPIDLSHVSFAGDKRSPIRIVLYVSATCPLCKRVYKALYYDVTGGPLRGIAKLGIKVFSVHDWDVALLAAQKFNKQSDLLLSLAEVTERISTPIVLQKAAEIGIPLQELRQEMADSATVAELKKSIDEAARNEVKLTPTVFIDGVRYRSYKDPQWITDAVLYKREAGKRKG